MRAGAMIALLLCLLSPAARAEDAYDALPYAVRFEQGTVTEHAGKDIAVRVTKPATCQRAVDEEIAALLDEMVAQARPELPEDPEIAADLDASAQISRCGERLLSFLILCEVSADRELVSVRFKTRVYDMLSGRRVTLADLFPSQSDAWDALARAAREQLSAAFPDREIDEEALDALCAPEKLREADFTLGPAYLTLTCRADALYPGAGTLLHVRVPLRALRPLMEERYRRLTDNSRYRLLALTFDDGSALGRSRSLLATLRGHGAMATYFIVGRTMRNNHNILARLQNAGFSVQSHTYTHHYADSFTTEEAFEDKERFADEMASITGVPPALLRAPGGRERFYIRHAYGYPLIHWTLPGGDSGGTDADTVVWRVTTYGKDGDIILLHETNEEVCDYTERILRHFEAQGFLFVTVQELFEMRGVPLEADRVYFSPTDVRDE